MNTKHEPCSICEKYMDGVTCYEDECPVAIIKAENERLKKKNKRLKNSLKKLEERIYIKGLL